MQTPFYQAVGRNKREREKEKCHRFYTFEQITFIRIRLLISKVNSIPNLYVTHNVLGTHEILEKTLKQIFG